MNEGSGTTISPDPGSENTDIEGTIIKADGEWKLLEMETADILSLALAGTGYSVETNIENEVSLTEFEVEGVKSRISCKTSMREPYRSPGLILREGDKS